MSNLLVLSVVSLIFLLIIRRKETWNYSIYLKRVREYERINNYKGSLKELMILLELEITFQNGNINLEAMNDRFIEKTIKFSVEKFDDKFEKGIV